VILEYKFGSSFYEKFRWKMDCSRSEVIVAARKWLMTGLAFEYLQRYK
jgi:hypothetical protein